MDHIDAILERLWPLISTTEYNLFRKSAGRVRAAYYIVQQLWIKEILENKDTKML